MRSSLRAFALVSIAFAFSVFCRDALALEPRTQMLIVGHIDGYAGEDDITAINRFLTAVTVQKLDIPSEVADWIVNQTKNWGPSAPPRLLSSYMKFLRNGVSAPPFKAGAPGSPRYRILKEALRQLQSQNTPICDLGALFFLEIDDPSLRQEAQAFNYQALRQHPWMVYSATTPDSWMIWALVGLNPDKDLPKDPALFPKFPLISPQAQAGQLPHVHDFLSAQPLKPPVQASSWLFENWADDGTYSWGHISKTPVPKINPSDQYSQLIAILQSASPRLAKTLSTSQLDLSSFEEGVASQFQWIGGWSPDDELRDLATYYTSALKLPLPEPTKHNATTRLAHILGDQQSRLFALSTYGLARARLSNVMQPKDIPTSDVFTELQKLVVPDSLRLTKIVQHLDAARADAPATLTLPSFIACDPVAFKLQRRDIALAVLEYYEEGTLSCKDQSHLPFKKVGNLATDYARMLEVNSYYLDITGASLALHDYTNPATNVMRGPDDLDLVTLSPWLTVPLCLAVIADQSVTWQEARDSLMQNYPRDLTWFVPGLQPELKDYPRETGDKSDKSLTFSNSLRSSDELARWSAAAFSGEINRLQAEARIHFANSLGPTVNGLPDTVDVPIYTCDNSSPPVCYSTTNTVHTPRQHYIDQLRQIADSAKPYEQNMDSLGAQVCKAATHMGGTSQTFVDTQVQNFLSIYTTDIPQGQCDGAIQGGIPTGLQSALQQALAEDPSFFMRYGVDAVPSSDDMTDRLTTALGSVLAQKTISDAGQQYLQARGLAVYLPSLPTPSLRTFAGDWSALAADPGGKPFPGDPSIAEYPVGTVALYSSSSPLDVTIAPLLGSVEGTELAQDLTQLQNFATTIPRRPYLSRYQVADSFWASLKGAEAAAIAKVYSQVDDQVRPIASQMVPQAKEWTVGFTLGIGSSLVPGISFSYNGFGVDIRANLPQMTVIPAFPNFKIPPILLPVGAEPHPLDRPAFAPDRSPAGVSHVLKAELVAASPDPAVFTSVPPAGVSHVLNAELVAASPDPAVFTSVPPPGVSHVLNAELVAASPDPVVFTSVPVGQPGWEDMLSQGNFVGRQWLQEQIALGTPNLTPAQLAQVRQGLQEPSFPPDLAKIVASAASKTSGSLDGIALRELQYTAPWVGGVCSVETYTHCAVAVNAAILLGNQSPQNDLVLAGLWGHAYDLEFDHLRKTKNLDKSTSDAEYIEEKVAEKLDPIEFGKDQAKDELKKLLKKYFPLLAPIFRDTTPPFVIAFSEFFRANVAGTEYEDLETMNREIQENLARQLDPFLNPSWKQELNQAATDASPQIVSPHVP